MKAIERSVRVLGGTLLLFACVMAAWEHLPVPTPPGPGPKPKPDPAPIASPFPAEGFWLLAASQATTQDGVPLAINSDAIRKEPGLQRRWHDYDQKLESPWGEALEHAKTKSGGKSYFVARHGSKAIEGPLTGSAADMEKTLLDALQELR